MKSGLLIIAFAILSLQGMTQNSSLKMGRLVYRGGGDWYANPTSLPNLMKFSNQHLKTTIAKVDDVDVASEEIYNYPFIHMTGHGNVVFNAQEIENLRNYLLSGGFLHIDDNYGMDIYIRSEIKKVFPEYELVELPFNHPIYHQKYNFHKGLPKIHEHDQKAPQGFAIVHEGRVVLYYTYESDLGDGWEDQRVHNDSEETRLKALQMGANILQYAFMGWDE
ncbi:MAG: DUF4159 domain-containing protein [Bacteroidetes bacterium]|nr:DUF4159 domain-containing protein [Bacteroidota bacterium]